MTAFVAAKFMGARLGRWDINGDPPMGSPTNAVIGLFMLWWGWLAFNAGSTFGEITPNSSSGQSFTALFVYRTFIKCYI